MEIQNLYPIPSGTILDYAGSTAPDGFLFPYGQAISRTTYGALFLSLIHISGSGDGSTTFNLPDLRGRVLAGKDNMGGSAANRITLGSTLGYTVGAETHTLLTGEMPSHTHDGPNNGFLTKGTTLNSNGAFPSAGSYCTNIPPIATTTAAAGSGGSHNNMQPSIIVNKIIKI